MSPNVTTLVVQPFVFRSWFRTQTRYPDPLPRTSRSTLPLFTPPPPPPPLVRVTCVSTHEGHGEERADWAIRRPEHASANFGGLHRWIDLPVGKGHAHAKTRAPHREAAAAELRVLGDARSTAAAAQEGRPGKTRENPVVFVLLLQRRESRNPLHEKKHRKKHIHKLASSVYVCMYVCVFGVPLCFLVMSECTC